jgi:hypothetical protein
MLNYTDSDLMIKARLVEPLFKMAPAIILCHSMH